MNRAVNILLLIVLSVVVVVFIAEVRMLLQWIAEAHNFLLDKLTLLIHGGNLARLVCMSLALILVPLILSLIPAFIYWIFRHTWMPGYAWCVWLIWVILVAVLAYK